MTDMIEHKSPETIAFSGDWHGNVSWALNAIRYAHREGADTILHVGDFGVWPNMQVFFKAVNTELTQLDMTLYFVDGNHEHFPFLQTFPLLENGFRQLRKRIFHIPRGHTWEWDGVRFMGLGGAYSIDRQWRVLNQSWFEEELMNPREADEAILNGANGVDILLTHDVPVGVDIPLNNNLQIPEIALYESYEHRKLLGRVVDAVRPTLLVHGHYHVQYVRYRKSSDTMILGLDCDGTQMYQNIRVEKLSEVLTNII